MNDLTTHNMERIVISKHSYEDHLLEVSFRDKDDSIIGGFYHETNKPLIITVEQINFLIKEKDI